MMMMRWILAEIKKKVADESCRENRGKNYKSNSFLSEKNVSFMRNSRAKPAMNQFTQYGAKKIQFECRVIKTKIFNMHLLAFERTNLRS